MSEDLEGQENLANEGEEENDSGQSTLTDGDKDALIEKLRKENAKRRVENRALAEKATEYDKIQQEKLSELEKAQLRIKELEEGSKKISLEAAFDIVREKYGFDDEEIEFVRGDTKEEILASAAKLAAKLKKDANSGDANSTSTSKPNLFPGRQGGPVGGGRGAVSSNDILRQQLNRRR